MRLVRSDAPERQFVDFWEVLQKFDSSEKSSFCSKTLA